jgi:hypothetical protein
MKKKINDIDVEVIVNLELDKKVYRMFEKRIMRLLVGAFLTGLLLGGLIVSEIIRFNT